MITIKEAKARTLGICMSILAEKTPAGKRQCRVTYDISGVEVACGVGVVREGVNKDEDDLEVEDIERYVICTINRATEQTNVLQGTADSIAQ